MDDAANLLTVLPANQTGGELQSHGGLTYGGFIIKTGLKTPVLLVAIDETFSYLQAQEIGSIYYKMVPHIYHRVPAQVDRYALFLCGAITHRVSLISTIDMSNRPGYQKRRRRGANNARKAGMQITETDDLAEFWAILEDVLRIHHDTKPVHTLEEIISLQSAFPGNIRLFAANKDEMLAGALVYETDRVARMQYIASSEEGRNFGALDLLFFTLIDEIYVDKPYIEFGTSDELGGRWLNKGLINHKEGFGARSIAQEHYHIDLSTWQPGQIVEAMT
jgi:hypothetical protein